MELLPEDMGAKWHVAVVRHRAYGTSVAWAKPLEPRLGRLGRLWTRDMKLSDEVAAATLPMASDSTLGYTYGLGIPAAIASLLLGAISASSGDFGWTAAAAGMAAGSLYGSTVLLPRHTVRQLHKAPLKAEEVERLLTNGIPGLPPFLGELANRFFRMWNRGVTDQQPDSLEQAFLALVMDVLNADNVPEASRDDLRLTLRALGDAVANLPLIDAEATFSLDAADLKADAEMLRERADRETDPIVAESLRRQAEAHQERARASEHASVAARRVRALREELRAQIDALRTALPSFGRATMAARPSSAGGVDTGSFARLSESIRSVAREANAVAEAEEELHASTWAAREERVFGNATVSEERVQQIRRG